MTRKTESAGIYCIIMARGGDFASALSETIDTIGAASAIGLKHSDWIERHERSTGISAPSGFAA
jgi:hypothetical protein